MSVEVVEPKRSAEEHRERVVGEPAYSTAHTHGQSDALHLRPTAALPALLGHGMNLVERCSPAVVCAALQDCLFHARTCACCCRVSLVMTLRSLISSAASTRRADVSRGARMRVDSQS